MGGEVILLDPDGDAESLGLLGVSLLLRLLRNRHQEGWFLAQDELGYARVARPRDDEVSDLQDRILSGAPLVEPAEGHLPRLRLS